jgi:methyltransferase
VFEECPWEEGYDVSIGTSERALPSSRVFSIGRKLKFKHLIIVFGGPRGLEYAASNDPKMVEMELQAGRTRELFDHWVNVLPGQGSRTIRTDEAVYIALTDLRRLWT